MGVWNWLERRSWWFSHRLYKAPKGKWRLGLQTMTSAVIALSFSALLMSFFILRGFQYEVSRQLYGFVGHVSITPYAWKDQVSALHPKHPFYRRYADTSSDTVAFIQGIAYQTALIKTRKQGVLGVLLKGIDKPYPETIFRLQKGLPLRCGTETASKECVISARMARQLRKNIQDTLLVHLLTHPPRFKRLIITGLYKTNIEEIDERMVITDRRLFGRKHKEKTPMTQWELFLKEPFSAKKVIEPLRDQLPYDYVAQTTQMRYANLFQWLALLDRNLYVFLTLIFLVVVFNVIALLILLIRARDYTIAVLKTLGASSTWIGRVFFYRASRLIMMGILAGNAVAFALGAIQKYHQVLTLDAAGYALEYVPIRWLPVDVIYLNVGFVMTLHLVVLLPIKRLLRGPILNALRRG